MRTYSLENFMHFPRLAFRLAMTQPFQWSGASSQHRPNFAMRLFFILGTSNLLYQNIGMLIYLLGPQASHGEPVDFVLQLSETGAILGLCTVAVCKMLLLFWHGDSISQLIEAFQNIFPSSNVQRLQNSGSSGSGRHCHLQVYQAALGYYPVHYYAQKSFRLMKVTTIFFMSAFCWYNLFPLMELLVGLNSRRFNYRYQSNTWYPWQTERNAESVELYLVTYLCQVHSSLTGVAFIMAGEFMLCFFVTQMQLHFDFLTDALENLDARGEYAQQELRYLIDYHNMLLSFSKRINEIFSFSFLINFGTSSIAICLMCCSIFLVSDMVNIFKFSVGLLSFLVFTLFICYNGSEFTSSSDKLMMAAFHNNWYEGSVSYRKMILFFMMRSMQPSVLRAHKFTTVSMQAFMAILEFSYKLFTFLRAMA